MEFSTVFLILVTIIGSILVTIIYMNYEEINFEKKNYYKVYMILFIF